MVELQWRLLTALFYTFTIATAGTLAAAHYCSIQYHCASSPYSGTEHSWGISLTQDSRDSFIDSDYHSNTPPLQPNTVGNSRGYPPRASALVLGSNFLKQKFGSCWDGLTPYP